MPRQIVVRGDPGSGKSTAAAELAARLGLTYIELDALHHGPNWSVPEAAEFQAKVRAAMAAAPGGWVIDGNYDSKLHEMVVNAADTIVWLDLPLGVKLRRIWRRTHHRIRNDVELWNGNRETWRGVFLARDSLFIWTLRSHVRHRRQWPARFSGDPRVVRLRSATEVCCWLDDQAKAQPAPLGRSR